MIIVLSAKNKNVMRNLSLKKCFHILVLSIVFLFSSCQKESNEEEYSTRETISVTSPLTTLLKRVAMQKTSQDNIVDNTSCFMIKFPYEVTVNGVEIELYNSNDYLTVQNNINASNLDNDIVYIEFPVSVILNDYTERYLNNHTAFNNLITECLTNENDFQKIYCLDINYPISLNSFNNDNQLLSSVSIANDHELFIFIDNLIESQYISIVFPVTVVNQNGQTITITNNSQFEDVIKESIDNCIQNPVPSQTLEQTITTGSWRVSYFYDDHELTSNYNGYVFTFNTNNTVTASKLGNTINGIWTTFLENGKKRFELKFQSNPLNILDEDWSVFEYNPTHLNFRDTNNGSFETDYLYLERN
jgi:hypothetical protein